MRYSINKEQEYHLPMSTVLKWTSVGAALPKGSANEGFSKLIQRVDVQFLVLCFIPEIQILEQKCPRGFFFFFLI